MHLISVGINTVESDMQNNGDKRKKVRSGGQKKRGSLMFGCN